MPLPRYISMEPQNPTDDSDAPEIPDALAAALREAPPTLITARVDRELDNLATEHFSSRSSAPRYARPAWIAIAASVVLGIAVLVSVERQPDYSLYSDVDRSGQVDIADVLALARDSDDFTRQELDAFAMSLVSLDGETS